MFLIKIPIEVWLSDVTVANENKCVTLHESFLLFFLFYFLLFFLLLSFLLLNEFIVCIYEVYVSIHTCHSMHVRDQISRIHFFPFAVVCQDWTQVIIAISPAPFYCFESISITENKKIRLDLVLCSVFFYSIKIYFI